MSKTISHLQKPWALASTFWSHEQTICKTHLQQPKIICNSNIVFNIDILVEKEYVASPEKKRFLRLILVGRLKKLKWWRSCRRSYYVFHPIDDIFFSFHRWYHFFFFTSLLIYIFKKKGHNPSFSNVAFLPFFAF